VGSDGRFGRFWRHGLVSQPIALAGDLDNLGVVQEAVEDRTGAGDVADQLAISVLDLDRL
jgi:hypothetical protein